YRLTGCRYHPMYPVFKLADMRIASGQRIVSPKAWLAWTITGVWAEDDGIASASGLLNLGSGQWDAGILRLIGIKEDELPRVSARESVVGYFHGTPVINGTGDGFFATLGSGGDVSGRLAATLGTTASVRELTPTPAWDESSGAFCYRATPD